MATTGRQTPVSVLADCEPAAWGLLSHSRVQIRSPETEPLSGGTCWVRVPLQPSRNPSAASEVLSAAPGWSLSSASPGKGSFAVSSGHPPGYSLPEGSLLCTGWLAELRNTADKPGTCAWEKGVCGKIRLSNKTS